MNLRPARARPLADESRFPTKATCLAIYSRVVNAEQELAEVLGALSLVRPLGRRAARPVRRLCRGQAAPARARLRRPAALLGADDARAGDRRRRRRPLRPSCWSTNIRTPTACRPRSCWRSARRARPDGRRRRRAVDLFVPRRHGAQHSRLPDPVRAAGAHRHARAQLPLDRADPRGLQRGDRARGRALHQESVDATRQSTERPPLVTVARRDRSGALRRRARAGEPRSGRRAEGAGGAVSRLASQRRARARAGPPRHSVRQIRRPEIPRRRACQGRAGAAALGAEPARPRRRLPRRCSCCRASARPTPAGSLDRRPSADPLAALAAFAPPRRRRAPWADFAELLRACAAARRLAGRDRRGAALVRPHLDRMHEDAVPREADLAAARADRRQLSARANAS